ncbi:E3 ubiquitin-protein ligase RNF25 [Amphibalanus amphitrite]|uniref:E3 ubiquitin-protein ligase RNF25 n=1 Tax=Amphibalanus amphitrite TaxID=1232801 RepID=A0A6A4WAY8_AMPAM|nr:E3 ubiquitin-protein ligase RNF25 [Amphibalanus amphitrite]
MSKQNFTIAKDIVMEHDDMLLEEVAALEATLMDDLNVVYNGERPQEVSVTLHPATAHNRDEQFVRMTLTLHLPTGYPSDSPKVVISNPRGISEQTVQRVQQQCFAKMEEYRGEPVLYQLIELARDHLTESNVPAVPCVICLYEFTAQDVFTKTACYHYFHAQCLARYVENVLDSEDDEETPPWQEKKTTDVVCPVCREPIGYDLEALRAAPPPELAALAAGFRATDELRSLQRRMAALFLQQQQRGGLIDLEQEKNKYLLVTAPETEQRPSRAERRRAAAAAAAANSQPGGSGEPAAPAPAAGRGGGGRGGRGGGGGGGNHRGRGGRGGRRGGQRGRGGRPGAPHSTAPTKS